MYIGLNFNPATFHHVMRSKGTRWRSRPYGHVQRPLLQEHQHKIAKTNGDPEVQAKTIPKLALKEFGATNQRTICAHAHICFESRITLRCEITSFQAPKQSAFGT